LFSGCGTVLQLHAVSIFAKLTRREAELLDRLRREYGFISKSEAIRSAIRLYVNLLELRPNERLRMLQLISVRGFFRHIPAAA
jgi:metal-responsive CopG/Arc/MetJ family transcriptional regulator